MRPPKYSNVDFKIWCGDCDVDRHGDIGVDLARGDNGIRSPPCRPARFHRRNHPLMVLIEIPPSPMPLKRPVDPLRPGNWRLLLAGRPGPVGRHSLGEIPPSESPSFFTESRFARAQYSSDQRLVGVSFDMREPSFLVRSAGVEVAPQGLADDV